MTAVDKAALCYNCAVSKKAIDVVTLDVHGISDITDVFLIASGSSKRQVQTIVDAVEEGLRAAGEKGYHIEGYDNAWWTLIDAGDVVIHVFIDEARKHYDLERLWDDAPRIQPDSAALTGA